ALPASGRNYSSYRVSSPTSPRRWWRPDPAPRLTRVPPGPVGRRKRKGRRHDPLGVGAGRTPGRRRHHPSVHHPCPPRVAPCTPGVAPVSDEDDVTARTRASGAVLVTTS